MKIVDLGEYSIAVTDDYRNRPHQTVENTYMRARGGDIAILINKGNQIFYDYLRSSNYLYSAGILIIYFEDKIPFGYHIGDEVYISVPVF